MTLSLSKYSGCGNDFILIDNRHGVFPAHDRALIQRFCLRPQGIGADGLILLESSLEADFGMRIFNADGGEAEMCGNGIRCLLLFIRELGGHQENYTIKTFHDILTLSFERDLVKASMPNPTQIRWHQTLRMDGESLEFHYLNTGVPHTILFVEDLGSPHWMTLAPLIRHHPQFAPQGTNVSFAKIDESGRVHLRTYERGVEQETMACGTGAVAAALAAHQIGGMQSPIQILPLSKDPLWVSFQVETSTSYQQIYLLGKGQLIFRGEWFLNGF